MDLFDALERAVTSTAEIVKETPAGRLDAPTPCTEWDVRALLNHVIGTLWLAEGLFADQVPRYPTPPGGLPPVDLAGQDPAAAYAEAAAAALAAAAAGDALTRVHATPLGEMPGPVLAGATPRWTSWYTGGTWRWPPGSPLTDLDGRLAPAHVLAFAEQGLATPGSPRRGHRPARGRRRGRPRDCATDRGTSAARREPGRGAQGARRAQPAHQSHSRRRRTAPGRRHRRAPRHHAAGGLQAPEGAARGRPCRRAARGHAPPVRGQPREGFAAVQEFLAGFWTEHLARLRIGTGGVRKASQQARKATRRPVTDAFATEVDLPASPEEVFRHLTDPAAMIRWLGQHATLEPVPGGAFEVDINGIPVREPLPGGRLRPAGPGQLGRRGQRRHAARCHRGRVHPHAHHRGHPPATGAPRPFHEASRRCTPQAGGTSSPGSPWPPAGDDPGADPWQDPSAIP